MDFFASCSRGIEPVLREELQRYGAEQLVDGFGGVSFSGSAQTAMRICLWARTPSRVLQPILQFEPGNADAIYEAASGLDWPSLFDVSRTIAVAVSGQHGLIDHTHYAGLKLKDAVADRFRDACGQRPSVDTDNPHIRLQLHLGRDAFNISLDWAGEALHRRGYRSRTVAAPLKESLAAAMLLRAGWMNADADPNRCLLDPMCGSGTIAIEAAQMRAGMPPGQNRSFAFEHLSGFDRAGWQSLKNEIKPRKAPATVQIHGSDVDSVSIKAARANAATAGVADWIDFQVKDFSRSRAPAPQGLLVCNPPYGERLSSELEMVKLYSMFGAHLRDHFPGWTCALLSPRTDLTTRLGLRAHRRTRLFNGPIECSLLECEIAENAPAIRADDFLNRLQKNEKRLRKWRKSAAVENYRLYDADLPDYALAVDRYLCADGEHLFVQEYAAPDTVDTVKAERRLRAALSSLQDQFGLDSSRLHFRRRAPKRRTEQYSRHGEAGMPRQIEEAGMKLLVNLDDYLDTGVFLDHRALRRRVREQARGGRFLNLFCYTGAVSVAAAVGGARQTVSVDMSNTYLDWAGANLQRNGFVAPRVDRMPLPARGHVLHRADCIAWLPLAEQDPSLRFDCILLDPPSFSNSTRMEATLDIQRDHVDLIRRSAALLAPGGRLLFSTNRRRFKLDNEALGIYLQVRDITRETIDPDFSRPRPPHMCWEITNK